MSKWYINDLELLNAIITSRKIGTPWAQTVHDIHNQKSLVLNPNKLAQPITLDVSLKRSTRFDMETSIRAELEQSPTIYVASTKDYVYEDDKYCWFAPSGMNIVDRGGTAPLSCVISGLVDERTIHSCDFTTNWSGTAITISTDTRFGSYSIKDTMSTDADHYTKYTFPATRDLSNLDDLHCWLKMSQASTWYSTCKMGISDGSTTTVADVTAFSADTWSYQTFDLENFAGDSSVVTEFMIKTNPPSATEYDIYIAWVWVE